MSTVNLYDVIYATKYTIFRMQDAKVKSKNPALAKKRKSEKGAANLSPSGQKTANEGGKKMKRKANSSDAPGGEVNKKQKIEEFSGTKSLTSPEGQTKTDRTPRKHSKVSEYHKAIERANSGIIARQTELRRINDRIKELASRPKLSKTARRKLANFRSLVTKLGDGSAPEGAGKKAEGVKQAKKRKLQPEEKPDDDSEGDEEKDSEDEGSDEQAEDVTQTEKKKSQSEDSAEDESEDNSEDEEDEDDSEENGDLKNDVKQFVDAEMKNGEDDSDEDDVEEEESDDDEDDSDKETEGDNSMITEEDDEDVKKPSPKVKIPEKKVKSEEKKFVNKNETSFNRDANNFSLFVANLSFEATKDDVEEVFGKLDGFVAIRMSRGATPDKHKGFAFVEMKDQESYDVSFWKYLVTYAIFGSTSFSFRRRSTIFYRTRIFSSDNYSKRISSELPYG